MTFYFILRQKLKAITQICVQKVASSVSLKLGRSAVNKVRFLRLQNGFGLTATF
jgi:hypothetical protein